MSILIGDNLEYKGKSPNFTRDQFETIQEMRDYPVENIDEGHISYVLEDKGHYTFKDGEWKRVNDLFVDSKLQLFTTLWDIACSYRGYDQAKVGQYNKNTGFFELNGIKDITLDQALRIYEAGSIRTKDTFRYYENKIIRTHLPRPARDFVTFEATFHNSPAIEIIIDRWAYLGDFSVLACNSLHTLDVCGIKTKDIGSNSLASLVNVTLAVGETERVDINFKGSNKLTNKSVESIINSIKPGTDTHKLVLHEKIVNLINGTDPETNEEWQALKQAAEKKHYNIQSHE